MHKNTENSIITPCVYQLAFTRINILLCLLIVLLYLTAKKCGNPRGHLCLVFFRPSEGWCDLFWEREKSLPEVNSV